MLASRLIVTRRNPLRAFDTHILRSSRLRSGFLPAETACKSFMKPLNSLLCNCLKAKCPVILFSFALIQNKNLSTELGHNKHLVTDEADFKIVSKEYTTRSLILSLLRYPWKVLAAFVLVLALSYSEVLYHLSLRDIFKDVGSGIDLSSMMTGSVSKFLLILSCQSVLQFFSNGIITSLMERWTMELRLMLFDRILHQNLYFFQDHEVDEVLHAMNSDLDAFKSATKNFVIQGIKSITQATGALCSLLVVSGQITSFITVSLPTLFLFGNILSAQLRKLRRAQQDASIMASATATESIGNVKTVKALAMEDYQKGVYENRLNIATEKAEQFGYFAGVFHGISVFSLRSVMLGTSLFAGRLIEKGALSLADLTTVLVCGKDLQSAFISLSNMLFILVKGAEASRRVLSFLNLPLEETASQSFKNFPPTIDVTFDKVSFAYRTRSDSQVLEDVSFHVPAGTITALVGRSGAGKSTTFGLLEKYFEPNAGQIKLGMINLRDVSTKFLRRSILGYISQETDIFNMTVLENIRCARPEATDAEVLQAARLANADEFVLDRLPQGYQTVITSASLSGGQKQRIAIARVLLKNAPIVLMDEATAALDPVSESLVQRAMRTALKGRTVLIIAHKLNTIKHADQILVLDHGRVLEAGTHDQLKQRKNGLYASLLSHLDENG